MNGNLKKMFKFRPAQYIINIWWPAKIQAVYIEKSINGGKCMKAIKRLMLAGLALCMTLGLCSFSSQASGGSEHSTAEEIRLGQDVYGTLVANQNTDYYKVEITDSGIYSFTGSNKISKDTQLQVYYTENWNIINSVCIWNNNTSTGTWNFDLTLSRGTYYVKVYEWDYRGDYSFKVAKKASANETIPDRYGDEHRYTTAHDMSVGQKINGCIANDEHLDYYRVVIRDSGIYTISGTTGISSDVDLTILSNNDDEIYNYKPVWNNNTHSGKWNINVALSQGTYYIRIREWDNNGLYSFKIVEKKSAAETKVDHFGDEHKMSTAHEISTGSTINGMLGAWEEQDYYRFKVSKAGTYTVSGTTSISNDTELAVYDKNGYYVSNVKPTWNNNKQKGTWKYNVSLGKGIYYISVYEFNDRGLYNFTITPHQNEVKKTALKVPTLKKLEGKKKSVDVKWSKVTSGITGYQIEYSTDKNFSKRKTKTVDIKKKSTSSHTIKKLKTRTRYYVRIRSYKKNGKDYTYSKWSKTKNTKTK